MFGLGGKQTIGMDVDRGAIKAAQVSKSSDGYVLTHVGYHRLPDGVIVDGEVADTELLSREIKAFWELHSFKGKNVILGVSGSNVIVRFVDFPRLSPEDLDSAMSFHAEEHIPMPIDEVVLDHVVLGPSRENAEEDRVLLVGAHREMISAYAEAVKSGGLKPAGIDVKALSLTRSTLPDSLFDGEESVLLLDVGTEMTNLVIMEGKSPALAQFVPIGFRDFVRAVGEVSGLEDDEAEKQVTNPEMNISPVVEGVYDEPEDLTYDDTDATGPLEILPGYDEQSDETSTFEEDPGEPERNDEVEYELEGTHEPFEETSTSDTDKPSSEDQEPEVPVEVCETSEETRESPSEELSEHEEETPSEDTLEESSVGEMSEVEPEALTEEMPPVTLDPALAYDVRRGLEDAAARLARDIERSIEYHNSRPGAQEVSRVVLSGEGALVRGLGPYIGELLGIRTEPAHPTAKLSGNRSNVSDEQLAVMEPVLAVALGLAMDEE